MITKMTFEICKGYPCTILPSTPPYDLDDDNVIKMITAMIMTIMIIAGVILAKSSFSPHHDHDDHDDNMISMMITMMIMMTMIIMIICRGHPCTILLLPSGPPAPPSACLVSHLTYSSLTVDIIMIMIMIMVRVILMAIMMITIMSYFSPTCR